jgi:hypothetical protein
MPQRRVLLEALLQAEESPDPLLESPVPAQGDAITLVVAPKVPPQWDRPRARAAARNMDTG